MKFYIETLGCKVNLYESNYIKNKLLDSNYTYTENISEANVIILNTCTVTNNSDNKSLKLARRLRRENENAILIVCGCSTQYDISKFNELDIDIIIGNQDKDKIIELINNFKTNNKKIVDIKKIDNTFTDMTIEKFSQVRAYIKIQDGCNNYCSYCIIPFVRGNIRFKDYNKVITEAKELISNGYQEIVLTGIHTGSYPNLPELINDLSKLDGIKRIRLSSIEITELDDKFINLLKMNNILCDNLHVPLQAGSDEILTKMNRKYNTKYYIDKINEIRTIRPDIYISTDVIVGHPHETDELFNETLELCKKIKFSKIHAFPYSDRKGTKASKMDNHVSPVIKKERSRILNNLSNDLEEEYYNKYLGKDLEALVEEIKDGNSIGHTTNFLKLKTNNVKINELVNVVVTKENICL